ncbi:MAG: chitobiase/beta-hexosaminidase C-terminal domain-containing protein [Muribaculaceae bacterium]|nr:chitobiase/beta-hexosaminidase C-terminal domain-containing protein [Muribaculaceae bacterium]
MKKILLTLLCLFSIIATSATETTIKFSEKGYTNAQEVTEVDVDDFIKLTFNQGSNNNNTPKYYNTGSAMRVYGGNTMTVSVKDGSILLNKVTMTTTTSNVVNAESTVTNGKLAIDGTTAIISEINSTETTFTQGGTSGHVRIVSLTIEYSVIDENVVHAPTFSVAGGTYYDAQNVEIVCEDENAEIYYTLDGETPSKDAIFYTGAITISENTTVKAIAYVGLKESSIATVTYEIIQKSTESYKITTTIEPGYHYIIVGKYGEDYYAMSITQNSNNRPIVPVTVSEDGTIKNPAVTVCEFETALSGGLWGFYDFTNEGYLYAASSSKNYLRVQSEFNDNAKATVEFGIDNDANVAKIIFQGENTRNDLRFNHLSKVFSCYSNDKEYTEESSLPVYLYQRVNDIQTGIEDAMIDADAPVEYYNLQGVKVANPENGIFIKRQGGKAIKVVL